MNSQHPQHIAIILDGNRRWARRHRMQPWKGHEKGVAKVHDLLTWSRELGIRELTLYCFSTENFKRPKKEVEFIMKVFKKEFSLLKKNKEVKEKKVRINAIGRLWMFPKEVQLSIREMVEETKNNRDYQINLALGYGGRQE